jgi:hypothetical protein
LIRSRESGEERELQEEERGSQKMSHGRPMAFDPSGFFKIPCRSADLRVFVSVPECSQAMCIPAAN